MESGRFRYAKSRTTAAALVAGLAFGSAGCDGLPFSAPAETQSATAEPSDPFMTEMVAATPTDETSIDPSLARVEPQIAAVEGAVTTYRESTLEQVDDMEHCNNQSDKVLLTFDDGSDPERVIEFGKVLEEYGVGAIFFPVADHFEETELEEMVTKLRAAGFWVGNHTKSHPDLVSLEEGGIRDEILGGVSSNVLRPSYGGLAVDASGETYFDNRVRDVAQELGYSVCMWTVDTADYDGRSVEEILARVDEQVRAGSVIVMHLSKSNEAQGYDYNTLEALPEIIELVRSKGLELCPIQDLQTGPEIPNPLPC